jgi:hypothetical protein
MRLTAYSTWRGTLRGAYYGAACGAIAAVGLTGLDYMMIAAIVGAIVGLIVGVLAGTVLGAALGAFVASTTLTDQGVIRVSTAGCALVAAMPALAAACLGEFMQLLWLIPWIPMVAFAAHRHARQLLRRRDGAG